MKRKSESRAAQTTRGTPATSIDSSIRSSSSISLRSLPGRSVAITRPSWLRATGLLRAWTRQDGTLQRCRQTVVGGELGGGGGGGRSESTRLAGPLLAPSLASRHLFWPTK